MVKEQSKDFDFFWRPSLVCKWSAQSLGEIGPKVFKKPWLPISKKSFEKIIKIKKIVYISENFAPNNFKFS